MSARPKILATGFTPFPGAPVNPTQWLMEELAASHDETKDGYTLKTAILPVDYAISHHALDQLANDFAPDFTIHFGLASEAKAIRLEKTARNEITADKPDNSGVMPPTSEIVDGAPNVSSQLPLNVIAKALQDRQIPVEWSENAGGYLCNYVFFHACREIEERASLNKAKSGFIHVPMTQELGGKETITNAQLLRASQIILKTCAALG